MRFEKVTGILIVNFVETSTFKIKEEDYKLYELINCNSGHFSRQNLKFIFHCAERMHRIKSLTMFHIATILPRGVITFTFINHSDNNSESRRHVCIFPHFPRVHAYTRASIYRDSDRVPDRAMNYRERTVTRLHRRCIIPAYRDTWLAVN